MKEVFITKIDRIASGGAGLARIEGKPVFINGSAPGETVFCRTIKEHPSWLEAELLEIIEDSPNRVKPLCCYYGKCGGCNLQHLDYQTQLAVKAGILKDVFLKIGGFNPPEPKVIPSPPWEYRNRIQFHIGRDSNKGIYLGLKALESDKVIPITDCPIAVSGIRKKLQVKNGLSSIITPEKDRFTVYSQNDLFLSENGITRGKIGVLDRNIILDVRVFFQSNGIMLEKLIAGLEIISSQVLNIDFSLPMADIFCGTGIFAAFFGDKFPSVDLVEENKYALGLAQENLKAIKTANFYGQKSEKWIKNHNCCGYGLVIADPPRKGFAHTFAKELEANGPPVLIYISCDPATLARDSKILIKKYNLIELCLYDFYPQTSHIESLAVFSRRKTNEKTS